MKLIPVILVWWGVSLILDPVFFPSPVQVLAQMADLLNLTELTHLSHSFGLLLIAYVLIICLSIFIGVLTIHHDGFSSYVKFIMSFLIKVPNVAYVTYFILFIGVGYGTILSVMLIAVIPVATMNIISIFENLNRNVLMVSDLYHIPFLRRVKYFYIPSLFDSFQTVFIMSFSLSFKSLIMAEFLGGLSGLGYGLVERKESFQMDALLAYILFITFMGIWFQQMIEWVFKRVKRAYYQV